jgi:hypothetical protein
MSNQPALYASGLGVLVSSPGALRLLEPGVDHQQLHEANHGSAHDLFTSHRLVCLGTGSPQLYYRFVVHEAGPTPDELERALTSDTFDIEVLDGGLVIRDGYDLLDWEPIPGLCFEFSLRAGRYHVTALSLPVDPTDDAEMVIGLWFAPTIDALSGDGWPYVEYS